MRSTRALRARLSLSSDADADADDPKAALKLANQPDKRRVMARTCSSPLPFDAQSTCSSISISSSSSACSTSKSNVDFSQRRRSRAPSWSTSSSSTKGSGNFSSRRSFASSSCHGGAGDQDESQESEEEDDDDDDRARRFGGCPFASVALNMRDDSNKENVAPVRAFVTQQQRLLQQRLEQEESVARRTRGRTATPMSTRSSIAMGRRVASPSSSCSSLSSPSTSTFSSSSSTRTFRRTVSSPTVSLSIGLTRKRTRATAEEGEEKTSSQAYTRARIDDSMAPPPPPTPQMTLNSISDGASSYISSQETALFDVDLDVESQESSLSSSGIYSRATSPALTEMEDEDNAGSRKTQKEDETQKMAAKTSGKSNIFAHARALLKYGCSSNASGDKEDKSVSDTVQVVGREKERGALQRFLHRRFHLFPHMEHSASPQGESLADDLDGAQDSGCLYVCGLPGTGKTALLRSLLSDVAAANFGKRGPRVAFVNCMAASQPKLIFNLVLQALGEHAQSDDLEAEKRLQTLIKDASQRILIVLDEIDHLLRSRAHQNVLYRLFSWGALSPPVVSHMHGDDNSSSMGTCGVIGIANSLDLTERFVPLLASKGAAPAVLHFRPFEAKEIVSVVRARLAGLKSRYDVDEEELRDEDDIIVEDGQEPPLPLFVPAALELASKKIAAATGDVRKALDTCRMAIDVVESDQRRLLLASSSPALDEEQRKQHLRAFTPSNAPKVTPAHILKVLAAVLGSPQLTKVRSLGLQPKLALLALLVAQKRSAEGLTVLGSSSQPSGPSRVDATPASDHSTFSCTRLADVETTYLTMLKTEGGSFSALERSELLDVYEMLEVQGLISLSASGSSLTASSSAGSPSGSVKRQLKAAAAADAVGSRALKLTMSFDDVLKGITTAAPASVTLGSGSGTAAAGGAGAATSKAVLESVRRIWSVEEARIRRNKGWQSGVSSQGDGSISGASEERSRVLREELGGGRGAQASF